MKQEKSCGAICWKRENGQRVYLLILHRNGGHWAFAKGHVEGAETESETALREIREETALQAVMDTGFRRTTSYSPAPGVMKEVVYFTAEVTGGGVCQPEEVCEMRFEPYGTALKILPYPADRALLQEAERYLAAKQS